MFKFNGTESINTYSWQLLTISVIFLYSFLIYIIINIYIFFFASGVSQLLPKFFNVLDSSHLQYAFHYLNFLSHPLLDPSTVVVAFPQVASYLAC